MVEAAWYKRGVARVMFRERDVRAKNSAPVCMWRKQAVIERARRVISIAATV